MPEGFLYRSVLNDFRPLPSSGRTVLSESPSVCCLFNILLPVQLDERNLDADNTVSKHCNFIQNASDTNLTESKANKLVDEYARQLLSAFSDPQVANIFESYFLDEKKAERDLWTPMSSFFLAATTVIPVGYGFVTPTSTLGRLLIVIYGLVGVPLVLVTLTDIGKFISYYSMKILPNSLSGICFLIILLLYLFIGSVLIFLFSEYSYLDSLYFSIISVFTIGFGDTSPSSIPVPYILLLIVGGVVLVTITLELLAAEAINHIHYMGRHVGKARRVAQKIIELAQNLSLNKGFNIGLSQIESIMRVGILLHGNEKVGTDDDDNEKQHEMCSHKDSFAFDPVHIELDFVDTTELTTRTSLAITSSRRSSDRRNTPLLFA